MPNKVGDIPMGIPISKEIHFPKEETIKHYEAIIEIAFNEAKKVDEEELIVAILYFTGIMFYYERDAVKQLNETISELMILMQSKDNLGISDRTFFKLFSYLYIHITELEELYVFLFNILNIPNGSYYELLPFDIKDSQRLNTKDFLVAIDEAIKVKKGEESKAQAVVELVSRYKKKEQPIWNRIKLLNKMAKGVNKGLGKILNQIYNNKLRNAFSHNDYRFSDKGIHFGDNHLEFLSYDQLLEIFSNTLLFASIVADSAFQELGKIKEAGGKEFTCKHGLLKISMIPEEKGLFRWQIKTERLTPYM